MPERTDLLLTLQFQVCPKSLCVSTPGHRTDLFQRNPENVLITDFFGSVRKVEITTDTISLYPNLGPADSRYLWCDFFFPDLHRWLCQKYWEMFLIRPYPRKGKTVKRVYLNRVGRASCWHASCQAQSAFFVLAATKREDIPFLALLRRLLLFLCMSSGK